MIALSRKRSLAVLAFAWLLVSLIVWISAVSPIAMALSLLLSTVIFLVPLLLLRKAPAENLWDRSMLHTGQPPGWYSKLWLWWVLLAAILVGIYIKFW
jgi:hypothetical protein